MFDSTQLTNANTEYEKLALEIYQTLNNAEGIQNINVQHNVKVKGKSGCNHQIDVYWEFNNMGETHRVAIECKNYKDTVSIGKVRDFFGVLHDIGGIKGIFVSKLGFQSGAKTFADFYGISLKEMRMPTDSDWEGRVKTIHFDIHAFTTNNVRRSFVWDTDWILQKYPDGLKLQHGCCTDTAYIFDNNDNKQTSLHKIESGLINPQENNECQRDVAKTVDLGNDAYMYLGNTKVKVLAINYTYDIEQMTESFSHDGSAIAKAILSDVKSGEIYFFDKYGNVNKTLTSKPD